MICHYNIKIWHLRYLTLTWVAPFELTQNRTCQIICFDDSIWHIVRIGLIKIGNSTNACVVVQNNHSTHWTHDQLWYVLNTQDTTLCILPVMTFTDVLSSPPFLIYQQLILRRWATHLYFVNNHSDDLVVNLINAWRYIHSPVFTELCQICTWPTIHEKTKVPLLTSVISH